jgi:hypothetical protein
MTDNHFSRRWHAAAHAMQSGVAMEMNIHPEPTEPKHLRVGVNTALTDHASLAKLLISKGVITEDEYFEALADGMEAEKRRYEEHLSRLLGSPVTLA